MAALKRVRQILKALADDTRLRIVNILARREVNVQELCSTLEKNQPLVSKHLTRLRLLNVVKDRRQGAHVYYSLAMPAEISYRNLMKTVTCGFSDVGIFKEDARRMGRIRKKDMKKKSGLIG
jgi:ArsR family transcriptional regulator, arsenate/arsenite/antimonite-responsive transcriptional repressor